MFPVETAFKIHTGLDGKALHNGYVYFGLPGQNPITAPATVYWDAAGTQPAAQPLRTTNGYIVRAGTPANVFFNGAYSELVQDSMQRQVFYAPTSDEFAISSAVSNFITLLATSVGSSLIGFIQTGIGAVRQLVQDALREKICVSQFGAIGNGVVDDTDAIKKALAATPSGAVLELVSGKTYKVSADQLVIDKSMILRGNNAMLRHDGGAGNKLLYIARDANTPAGDIDPFYTLSRIKITDLRVWGATQLAVDAYDHGAAQGLVPDTRTSTCAAIYMEDVDALIFENVYVRGFKNSGFVFGDKSSVRESTFKNVYALECGDSAAQRPSILVRSPVATANNGIHNHLYFEHLRVVNSMWRSFEVSRGASVASAFGTFIIEINHAQIDNALPVGPVGPKCEMVLLEHSGWHVSISNSVILNPAAGNAAGTWGYPCLRIGTDNYANSTVERVELHNNRFQHATYGVGVQVARANLVRFTMNSWASEPTKSRSVVVANFNANDVYGVTTAVNVNPYLYMDSTNDFSDQGPYFNNESNRVNCVGLWNKPAPSGYRQETFCPGGFSSGRKIFTIAAATTLNTVIALKDLLPSQAENDINGTTWMITATAMLSDGSQTAAGAAIATFIDANLVGAVFPSGLAKSNAAVLDLQVMTPGGAAPGGFIPGSGNRVQIYIANTSATKAANVTVSMTRLGA